MRKRAFRAFGVALAGLLVVGYVYVVKPRRLLARYDRFVAAHPVGSPIADAVDDPFVREATMVSVEDVDGGQPRFIDVHTLAAQPPTRGNVDVMWTHTPPFGRVFCTLSIEGGRITSVRRGSLD